MVNYIIESIENGVNLLHDLLNDKTMLEDIKKARELACTTFRSGHKVLLCGNGVSVTDPQHIAAELVGRFVKEKNRMDLKTILGKRRNVIGDFLVDTYFEGVVKRISPEAPVPIISINDTYCVLDDAANGARNLIGIEYNPVLQVLIGSDENRKLANKMFEDKKMIM